MEGAAKNRMWNPQPAVEVCDLFTRTRTEEAGRSAATSFAIMIEKGVVTMSSRRGYLFRFASRIEHGVRKAFEASARR